MRPTDRQPPVNRNVVSGTVLAVALGEIPHSAADRALVTAQPTGDGIASDHPGGADRVVIEANTENGEIRKIDAAPHAPNRLGDTGTPGGRGMDLLDAGSRDGAAAQHDAAAGASSDPAAKTVAKVNIN